MHHHSMPSINKLDAHVRRSAPQLSRCCYPLIIEAIGYTKSLRDVQKKVTVPSKDTLIWNEALSRL